MEIDIVRYLLVFITIAVCSEAIHTNESLSEERRPRVTGRIVKLYSGTRPDPIICAKEGFQADPLDCAVFYRCIKGSNGKFTVFRYQCGPGTVFDPEKDVCNHQKNTKRINCGGKTSFRSSLNTPTNENDIDFGGKQEIPSPIRIKNIFQTNKPSSLRDITHFDPDSRWQLALQQSAKTSSRSISTSTTLPRIVKQSESDVVCESDGFKGDTENCRKFYRCVNNGRGGFIKYEFSCSESTVWDDENQACNHPWSVKKRGCGRKLLDNRNSEESNKDEDSQISASTIQEQSQINYGNKVSQTQVQINKGSAIQNQSQINYGSNTKPNQKQENYGFKNKQNKNQASPGSAVSQTQSQINYGNKGVQSQTQIDHTEQSSQSQTQVSETSDEANPEVENPNSKPNKSDSKCKDSGFKSDPNDCKKFYRCVDNGRGSYTKYEFTCGEGTVWDPKIDACNHAWAVKECGNNKPMASNSDQESTTHKTTTHKTTTQVSSQTTSTDTDDYEEISYGNQQPQPTSSTIKPIQTTSESIDNDDSMNSDDCKSSGFMGDTKNCKKFYRCVDNGRGSYTKYEFTCGEGTVWDQSIEACNHAWAVKKCGQKENQPVKTTTESSSGQSTHDVPVQNDDYDGSYNQQTEKEPSKDQKTTSTTHKPPQTQGSECQSSGFMGDDNDCKKFYRCVDSGHGGFIRYEFTCGEGTVWDPKIEACNHQWAVPKCGGVTEEYNKVEETTTSTTSSPAETPPETDEDTGYEYNKPTSERIPSEDSNQNSNTCQQEGFMGDSDDCKKFYRCVSDGKGHYTKYEFICGEGTVWDDELKTCNHPSPQNQCGNKKPQNVYQPAAPENDEMYTETTTEFNTGTYQEASSTKQPSLSKDSCTSEGFYGDSNDCKKFYRCVDNGKGSYTKYDFVCGDGTVWDQEIQACNHETNDKNCRATQSSSSSHTEPIQQTTETYDTSKTTTQPSKQPSSPGSQDSCTSEGFFANSKDCKKFFRCVSNEKGGYTKYDFTCGEGTVWVQEIQACDHDNDIGSCSMQQSQSSSSLDSENVPDKQSDEYPENETTSAPPPENKDPPPPKKDDDKCTSEGFYGNKNDCKKFYRCVDEGNGKYTRYDFTCGEGTAWDQDLQTCNHISSVKGCDGSTQQQTGSQTDSEETQGSPSTEGAEPQGSDLDSTQTTKPSKDKKCEIEGFSGDTEDCKKFYRCVDNGKGGFTKYDFTCGEGTIWDQDLTTCNHPQDVSNPSCQQSSSDSSSDSTTSSTTTSTESSHTTQSSGTTDKDNGNSSDCNQEDSSSKPSKSKINCTEAGFYPDPDDCKKFYRCVDWDGNGKKFSVYHFECGEGTIWDPALDTCNHEESVYPPRDCSKQQQSETVDQESTTESSTTTTESEDQTTTTTEKQETTTKTQTTEQQTEKTTKSSESTTTEKSETTTEAMTTKQQETTTQESTTTQQSTTTQESTTTQQSTTTQESSTEETTTQQITTAQTTQSSQETTTESQEKTTTESSSTEESTTQQSTTDSEDNSDSTTESTTNPTTESMTDQTTESMDSTTESSSGGEKECPETDDDQYLYVCPTGFRRHPKYCNLFYQCTEDDDTHEVKVATFHCPNNTIYDENKNQCVDEEDADKKCDGEIANRRRFKRLDSNKKEPIIVSTQKRSCPTKGHYPFDKTDECSPAFLKCETSKSGNMRAYVYRCPENYVYWSVSRRCEPKSYLKNCNNSNTDWSSRYEIPIETRNVSFRKGIDERKRNVQ